MIAEAEEKARERKLAREQERLRKLELENEAANSSFSTGMKGGMVPMLFDTDFPRPPPRYPATRDRRACSIERVSDT